MLEQAVEGAGIERLEVTGLSFGAINWLLSERLERALPRRALRRVFETSQGNPLFALELGRTLIERGVPEIGAALPLPGLIEDLFGERLSELAPPPRQVLLTAGLKGSTRASPGPSSPP